MPDKRTTPAQDVPTDPVALARRQANLPGLDYRAEAARLGPPPCPIIDAHVHINGPRAAEVLAEVAEVYGIERFYSQTPIHRAAEVRAVLGERVRFVAVPDYASAEPGHALRAGFVEGLERWAGEFGARMFKLWAAPRFRDYAERAGLPINEIVPIDSHWRQVVARRGEQLGMMMMVHVADPDTWFATDYADAGRYGRKSDHYAPFERVLRAWPNGCLAAHMAGSPEDLSRLSGLLDRWPNLIIDTSATRWMVRELSRHPRAELVDFFERSRGRVLFGSDIVASEDHLGSGGDGRYGASLAASEADAFDLYASRYWALRTMLETAYDGPSNIADPDLMKLDPVGAGPLSAPRLVGRSLSPELLGVLYRGACAATLDAWYESKTS